MERDFLIMSVGVLREGVAMSDKYAVIAAHRAEYPIALMCRVLAVSRSGFYAAQGRGPSERATADGALATTITATFARCQGRYGPPASTRSCGETGTPWDASWWRGSCGRPVSRPVGCAGALARPTARTRGPSRRTRWRGTLPSAGR